MSKKWDKETIIKHLIFAMTFRMVFLTHIIQDSLMFSSTNILFENKVDIPAKNRDFCKKNPC